MSILFVNSCIRKDSRTKVLCDTLLSTYQEKAEELDLQNMGLQPLTEKQLQERETLIKAGKLENPLFAPAHQFAAADSIIIGAPYYDLQFPALLKIYLENICVCGISFRYSESGRPLGLCRAKELIYVTTAGGYIGENNFGYNYIKGLAHMLGIENTRMICAEGLDVWNQDIAAIMEKAKKQIKE